MSLDVRLISKYHVSYDNGKTLQEKEELLFEANITHNLGEMADTAGIYKACWRPVEIGATKAKDILPLLEKGYSDLKARPYYFKQYDSSNGWCLYEHFLPWVEEYMNACKEYPESTIWVGRQYCWECILKIILLYEALVHQLNISQCTTLVQ